MTTKKPHELQKGDQIILWAGPEGLVTAEVDRIGAPFIADGTMVIELVEIEFGHLRVPRDADIDLDD